MTPLLFLAQRLSAAVLALAVVVHLATILYAVRGGLTAGEILARTHGNVTFFVNNGASTMRATRLLWWRT